MEKQLSNHDFDQIESFVESGLGDRFGKSKIIDVEVENFETHLEVYVIMQGSLEKGRVEECIRDQILQQGWLKDVIIKVESR